MDWIGIVGGHPHDVAHLAAAAAALGLRTAWASSARGGVPGVRRIAGSPTDPAAILAGLRDIGRAAVVGVVAADRRGRRAAWDTAEALGLPRLRSPGAAALAESRISVMARLAEAGVRVPSWRRLQGPNDIPQGHAWEWAVKIDREGPSPVILPSRRMQAAAAFAAASAHAGGRAVYAQRWIASSVHIVAQAVLLGGNVIVLGLAHRAFVGTTPYAITSGFDVIDLTGYPNRDRIAQVVQSVARACRWTWGPVVLDLVLEAGPEGNVIVVDASPGLAEFGAIALLDAASGYEGASGYMGAAGVTTRDDPPPYAGAIVRAVIGQAGAAIIPATREAALRYVVAVDGDEGRLVEQYEARPRHLPPGAWRWIRPGDRVREPRSRRDIWGMAIAAGGDGVEARADVLAAECYSSILLEGESDVDID